MPNHLRPLLVFATFVLFILAGCSRIPDSVKIGVAQPLSGPLKPMGADMLDGVQLAVNELNAANFNIHGKPVRLEVVSADDKASPGEGKIAARKLVDAGVVAVVGHLNSGVSIAAAPIYAQGSIPQLAISTKPEFTRLNLATTLRLVANDDLQSKALGSFAATQIGGTKFAVVDDGSSYGKGLADLADEQIRLKGQTVVLRKGLDDKTTNFAGLITELRSTGADVFVTTLADFQVEALIDQLVRAGLTKIQIIGSDNIKTSSLPKAVHGIAAVYATSPIVETEEFVGGRAFLQKFRHAYGHDPVYGAQYAYDAIYILCAAMKRGESVDPEKVLAELKRIDALAPVTNNIRFKPDGEQFYGVVSVYKVRGGRWEAVTRSDTW